MGGRGDIMPPSPHPHIVELETLPQFFFKAISISKSFSAGVLKLACSAFQAENQKTKFTKVFNISQKKCFFEKNPEVVS